MSVLNWCGYCQQVVNTYQMRNRSNDILGNPIMIIEHYCITCCKLIFAEEKLINNGGGTDGSDNI